MQGLQAGLANRAVARECHLAFVTVPFDMRAPGRGGGRRRYPIEVGESAMTRIGSFDMRVAAASGSPMPTPCCVAAPGSSITMLWIPTGRRREERHVLVADLVGLRVVPGGFLWMSGPPSSKPEPSGVDGRPSRRLPEGPGCRAPWIAERDALIAPGELVGASVTQL